MIVMNMRNRLMFILLTLVALAITSDVVMANDFVCGDSSKLVRYIYSVDPSTISDGTCTSVAEASIVSQRALLVVTPFRYLKVVGGLAVEMTQVEKNAVDAAIAAANAPIQALLDELANSGICNITTLAAADAALDARKATLDAQIDGIAAVNLATLKGGLHGAIDEEYFLAKKILRCFIALFRTVKK
jgi:hypothetical protein